MKSGKLLFALAFVLGLTSAPALRAQPSPPIRFPELPPTSPACTNIQRVGFTEIRVVYSRPSKRRHVVFGGLVMEGEIWRTGDNASTKIRFSTPVRIGGADGGQIPAGEYALYTIPDEKEWTIILYKDVGLFGKEGYDPKNELGRFKVAPIRLADPVETFTIDVNDIQDDSATINLMWDRVKVPIKVEVEFVSDLLVKIKASMDSSARKFPKTYLDAATFFFDHTKDLTQALLWVNEGLIKPSPISYQLLYLKARILARQGDRAGAIAAADESTAEAIKTEGTSTAYTRLNLDVKQSLR